MSRRLTFDVELMRRDFAIVRFSARWWLWLFFNREIEERYAIALPAVTGGLRWYWDHSSERVPPAVQRALERALADLERSEVRASS